MTDAVSILSSGYESIRISRDLRLAVGGENTGRLAFGQIEGVKIGPAAQHRLVGILLHHRVGLVVDDLINDRGRGLIDESLTRYDIARGLRIVTHHRAGVGRGDALAG